MEKKETLMENSVVNHLIPKLLPEIDPYAPILKRFESKSYYSFIQIRNMKQFDASFTDDKELHKAIIKHLKKGPNTRTFTKYARHIINIIEENNYNFHEVIVPNQLLFAFSLDVDCNDLNLSSRFYSSDEDKLWPIQIEFFNFIKAMICLHFKLWYNISDLEETSIFAYYLSFPDSCKKKILLPKVFMEE